MSRNLIFACQIFLIFAFSFSIANSEDLYLLNIDSKEELGIAKELISNAHGQIDYKFIINIDESDASKLSEAGLNIQLMARDIEIRDYYLLSLIHAKESKSALYIEPLYESDNYSFLIELSASSADILRKDGYMAINLEHLITPLYYNANVVPTLAIDDFPNDSLANLVSQDSIYFFNSTLEVFQSRFIYSDSIHSARDWLVAKYQSFGYTNVSTQLFYYNSYPCYNVLCYKQGTTEADKLVVIGGHYDSINFDQGDNGLTFAPGSDDNGSGSSITLEMARILKDVETKKSYLFCAFSAEEVGLVGSYVVAQDLYYNSSYDVEAMFNFDMVGFTADDINDAVDTYGGSNISYSNVFMAAASRVTTLNPVLRVSYGNSDHASFQSFGFNISSIAENDFNTLGWHTDLDLTSRMDFEYMAEVGKMSAAALGVIDQSASITEIEQVWDIGNGEGLQIEWNNCNNDYDYIIYFGTESGNYIDSFIVTAPVSSCTYDLSGLTTGVEYFFSVKGINPDGYGPIYLLESSGTPYLYPQAPVGVNASPDLNVMHLRWSPNVELDLNHYNILRRPEGGLWETLVSGFTDTTYDDYSAEGHANYDYLILAIDNDGFESDSSLIVSGIIATFDWNLLFVDETSSSGGINPSETNQALMYDSLLLNGIEYDKFQIASGSDQVSKSLSGQYASIIWLDDDLSTHYLNGNVDTLKWYLDYSNNLFIAGWQTIFWITGDHPLSAGNLFYDYFGISQVTDNVNFDFIGAFGENGWPNLQTDTDNVFSGFLPNISKLALLPGAEVIYRLNTTSDDPAFENEPAGVLYDDGSGVKIALSFPVYHLTDASASALMNKVFETFGIDEIIIHGDADGNGVVNILDITRLIVYLYGGGPDLPNMNMGDPNADCAVNILDISYLIAYLYLSGPQPLPGCVE